nr:MFS transporter [Nakamurella flavida]
MSPARTRLLVGAGVVLLALNLRPAVNAVGAVIPVLQPDVGLSGTGSGLLLSLPTVAFAVLGLSAPRVAERFGAERTVVAALAAMIVGQVLRSLVPGLPALFGGSLIALTGIAVANVLIPGLVRKSFPDRIAGMTAAYTVALTLGAALSAAVTLPFGDAVGGGWRTGLALWAATAAVAMVPWLAVAHVPTEKERADTPERIGLGRLARTSMAWVLAGFFGTQALIAYVTFGWLPSIAVDRGLSTTAAGLQVTLATAVGLPVAAIVPLILGRARRPGLLVLALSAGYVLGFGGLILQVGPIWLLATLIGVGTGVFPLVLTLIALRARTTAGALSLSAFTQSVGYLLASAGPVGFGALHDATGDWTVPLLALLVVAVAQAVLGLSATRPRYIEDALSRR